MPITLYSRRSLYVHKPHTFDSPPQRLVSDLTCLRDTVGEDMSGKRGPKNRFDSFWAFYLNLTAKGHPSFF
jgi:hypothetical protein